MGLVGGLAKHIMSNKMSSATTAFGIISGLDTYQTAREEGGSFLGAVGSAAADIALPMMMGAVPYLALSVGKELAGAAISGGYDAYRQYASNLGQIHRANAFSNASFNDTEQVHTMRQAGMAIAQRSRYNTQQAMMGNEAKYMMK